MGTKVLVKDGNFRRAIKIKIKSTLRMQKTSARILNQEKVKTISIIDCPSSFQALFNRKAALDLTNLKYHVNIQRFD